MINGDRWINSIKKEINTIKKEINGDRWIDTIKKEDSTIYNDTILKEKIFLEEKNFTDIIPPKKNYNSFKKYSLAGVLFLCGLLIVSAVKNETRNLQKEINNLEASIDSIQFNLNQATLDNEVITSPENISLLAKEYLNSNFKPYNRSQIRNLDEKYENLNLLTKKEKSKNLTKEIKTQVAKRIKDKKNEIMKLQKLYSNPKKAPEQIRQEVARQIEKKKSELKDIYESPKEMITLERVQRWGVVQVVKAFLGMPIIPGR